MSDSFWIPLRVLGKFVMKDRVEEEEGVMLVNVV